MRMSVESSSPCDRGERVRAIYYTWRKARAFVCAIDRVLGDRLPIVFPQKQIPITAAAAAVV